MDRIKPSRSEHLPNWRLYGRQASTLYRDPVREVQHARQEREPNRDTCPLEGLTEEQIGNGEDYMSVMRENLEALRTGLGCE